MSSGVILKARAVDLRKTPSKSQNCSELQVESCNLNDGNRRQAKSEISEDWVLMRGYRELAPVQQKCQWGSFSDGAERDEGPGSGPTAVLPVGRCSALRT